MDREKLQLCADAELPAHIFNLPHGLQETFLRAANQLMQKEAETFLDIISSSRHDLVGNNDSSPKRNIRSPYLQRKGSTVSQRPVTADYEKAAVDQYLRTVGRERTMPMLPLSRRPATAVPGYARPVTAGRPVTSESRPGTSHRIRLNERAPLEHELSLDEMTLDSPTPRTMMNLEDKADDMAREHQELLQQMDLQGQYISEERRRQLQLLKERKEEAREKKQKVANIAETLIDQGKQMDEKQSTTRQRQQRLLQERLEKKRFQRRKSQMGIQVGDLRDLESCTPNSDRKYSIEEIILD